MIASLPMYDRPENRAAHDALWAGVRAALGAGPETLDHRLSPPESWAQPDLLLGQICNLPYRAKFRAKVTRVGSAVYDLPDTPPGYYHSVFVARSAKADGGLEQAARGRFAYNEALSHSGWGGPIADLAARGVSVSDHFATGTHRDSMIAVAEGRADLAAIDAITWNMFCRWEPATAGLRVIERTSASPGMTFITADPNRAKPLFAALETAIAALPADHKNTLGLRGIVRLPESAYDIPLPPMP